ncbi:chitin synthase-domain-containing protein [Mucor lusitanicus]|uniref:chitin synthase n=1 Tax=Mucor circinelloides f. lusitanicus TaxID=29924 RepID=A0A8H4BIU3_MUCCL|nr:chitin synthase-domain-containing protein [Mucor lusitanicus]
MAKIDSKHMRPPSCRRIVWVAYAKICTILIPDAALIYFSNGRLATKVRRKAWREKMALLLTLTMIAAAFCFWLEFITTLFCDPPPTYDYTQVYSNTSESSAINGDVVNWHDLEYTSEMIEQVNKYPHYDLSPMFPSFMALQRPAGQTYYNNKDVDDCINGFNKSTEADNWLSHKLATDPGYVFKNNRLQSCPLPYQRNKTGTPCFYSMISKEEYKRYPKKGSLKFNVDDIYNNFSSLPHSSVPGQAFVILDNRVLDVTDYLDSVTNIVKVANGAYSRAFALDRMFLPLDLTILLFVHMGEDISAKFHSEILHSERYKECLFQLFYHGVIDGTEDEGCSHINLALWITMGCFLLYFLLKMNLANLSRLKFMQHFLYKSVPTSTMAASSTKALRQTFSTVDNARYLLPYTLLFIPCYAESSEALRQTFDSLARTTYPDTRKLLFFVCDGLVKSRSDSKETYLCILDALGYSSTEDRESRAYISLGQGSRRVNYAKVYAGFYESGRNRVPFLMVVKVGAPNEALSTARAPGNRGKRDSMVIVLSFLERCMNLVHNRITPLDFELFNLCYNLLGIDPREFKYMLVTDADTQVQDDVVFRMVSRLEADPKILAINGHIRPANPEENIVTMLQIFPLYMTFYSGLAYEACLGRVTTINGGFVMYRIWTELPGNLPAAGDTSLIGGTRASVYESIQLKRVPGAAPDATAATEPLRALPNKWPKVSDEIVVVPADSVLSKATNDAVFDDEDEDNSSSDDNVTTTTTNTTITTTFRKKASYRRRLHKKKKKMSTQPTLSLLPNANIQPCCIQPTVLRGFAAPRPDTMHMENVLLLGEEQYFGIVLLRSNPQYRFAFEPEAIAYATLPTNFFALQALQIRNLRVTFNTQVEFQHVAKHLGLMYWLISFTKLLDMIFSTPIIVYLYTIYIRYFRYKDLAYAIIAGSFTCLIVLHIFYFVIRRQFKYVLWFCIYGLFSVPIFGVYFPILAIWYSDYAYRWYDVWPTQTGGYHSRLHGIVMGEKTEEECLLQEETDAEDVVTRMRLADFEVLEAEKMAQREKEQTEILDAKFSGFTGYVSAAAAAAAAAAATNGNISGHTSKPSWSSSRASRAETPNSLISSPPLAQVRNGMIMRDSHSRFASEDDARFLLSPGNNKRSSTPRTSSINSITSSPRNPFVSALDDPFDDVYEDPLNISKHRRSGSNNTNLAAASAIAAAAVTKASSMIHHKASNSQSSYFSRTSFNANSDYPYYQNDMFVPTAAQDVPNDTSGGFATLQHRIRSYSATSASSAVAAAAAAATAASANLRHPHLAYPPPRRPSSQHFNTHSPSSPSTASALPPQFHSGDSTTLSAEGDQEEEEKEGNLMGDELIADTASVISLNPSLSNSVISLERDAPVLEQEEAHYTSPHHILSNRHNRLYNYSSYDHHVSEGRNAPVHSRIASKQQPP